MLYLAIVVGGLALVIAVLIIVKWAGLPPWTHRDVLAFVALIATIGGAMILSLSNHLQLDSFTDQANRLIDELVRARGTHLDHAIGDTLKAIIDAQSFVIQWQSVGMIIVLLSLGLVISARTLKGKIFGNEFEMGTGEQQRAAAEGARQTAVAAEEKAEQIAEGGVGPPPAADLPDYAK